MCHDLLAWLIRPTNRGHLRISQNTIKITNPINATLACVHPPPPLQKIVFSRRFFLEGGDDGCDGCDTGYVRLTLSPHLHVKPLQYQIDLFASFACQTADICNNSY